MPFTVEECGKFQVLLRLKVEHETTGEAADFQIKTNRRFFVAGFFNRLLLGLPPLEVRS